MLRIRLFLFFNRLGFKQIFVTFRYGKLFSLWGYLRPPLEDVVVVVAFVVVVAAAATAVFTAAAVLAVVVVVVVVVVATAVVPAD